MTEDTNTSLVKHEPKSLTVREKLELYSELKRKEVEDALAKGYIRDPVTAIFTIATLKAIAISLAVSAVTMLASSAITRALTPKAKPLRQGGMSGEVQGLMRSEHGILIDEIYGADPGDGKGGIKKPATIFWTSKIRKNIIVTRQEVGGGKGFGGSHSQPIENVVYDLDFAAMGGRGPLVLKREWGNADKIIDLDTRGYYEGEDGGNTFTAPYQISEDKTASDGQEVTLQNANPATSGVQFNAVVSNGAVTRELTIYYVNTGTISGQVIVNAGTPQSVSFPNSSNARSSIVVNVALTDGDNVIKIRNLSLTLNLRIDRIFCFPGFSEADRTTGILDTGVGADPVYDPELPPDPTDDFLLPFDRHNLTPARDAYGVHTGQTVQGAYADYAVYPGNDTQLQDPVIEAAVDAQFGAGSTPAYRQHAFIRHSNFALSRWGGVMPNISQLWEHETLKNLAQICGHWCDRVGMLTTDYDFSGIQTAKVRGLLLSGRRYAPKEPMAECAEIYDCFFTEVDGKVIGLFQEDAPTITIPETEIGWLEEDAEPAVPSIDTELANEIDLPSRIDVKSIDPDREYEPNTSGEARQITEGKSQDLLEVAITLTDAERRAVAARQLYREYVRGTKRRFTLTWSYLYLYPGYIVNTTKNGIAISMQITAIKGGIGLREHEAEDIEIATFTQSPSVDDGVFEMPPAPIPQMTIVALMDTPLLRDGDETINNGSGKYVVGTPRTGEGVWNGWSLHASKVGWERLADFTLPGTMGRQVLANGASAALADGPTFVFDTNSGQTPNTLTADFYGTLAPPESATEEDVRNGANALLVGDEVLQYTTRTQVGGFPNRWTFSGLLRGRRGTENQTSAHVLNERVIVLNEAVQFVPMSLSDLNIPIDYKAVSHGQSLDDAATIEDIVWTGKSLQPLSTVRHTDTHDSADNSLLQCDFRTRVGGGLRSYQAGASNEEIIEGRVQPVGTDRIMPIIPGMALPALLESDGSSKFDQVTVNSIAVGAGGGEFNARSLQKIPATGNSVEGTINANAGFEAYIGLIPTSLGWRGSELDLASLPIYAKNQSTSFTVYEYGVQKHIELPVSGVMRIKFVLSGSEIRVYRNWTGPNSIPVYISPIPGTFPLHAFARVDGVSASVTGIIMTCAPQPMTVYSAAQKVADGFVASDPIEYDFWQISKSVGKGSVTRITL